MLNGKFYTGLTANQLNRTRTTGAPDRLKSSFFWPDETDAQPSTQYRASSRAARRGSATTTSAATAAAPARASAERDIQPKELFHKQLTSKIEFNDELSATPKPRRRAGAAAATKLGQIATPQDISDIAASIEKPTGAARDRSANRRENNGRKQMQAPNGGGTRQPVQQQRIAQPKNGPTIPTAAAAASRRKITFDEPKRGILKNNEVERTKRGGGGGGGGGADYVVEPIPVYKKNIVPRMTRLQLSKSMDNFARLDIAGSTEKTKRNNVEHEREQNQRRETKHVEPEEEEDYPEREYYEKWDTGDDYADAATANSRNTHNGYSEEEQTRTIEKRDDTEEYHQHYHQKQHQHHQQQNTIVSSKNTRLNTYADADVVGYAKHYADVKQAPAPAPVAAPVSVALGGSGRRHYANEAAMRAQTHLRSNIFFNDGDAAHGSGHADDRPRSVRESAVSRVGVGLPNI